MIDRITDYEARGLALLPWKHREKPRIVALVRIFAKHCQYLENGAFDVGVALGIDDADTARLDQLGVILGQPRNGMVNAAYRLWLKAKARVLVSDGTTETLIAIFAVLYPEAGIRIVLYPPASFILTIEGQATPSGDVSALVRFLSQGKADGVRSHLVWTQTDPAEAFMFARAWFLDGSHNAGSTLLTVLGTVGEPPRRADGSGSLILDEGTADEELVTYTGIGINGTTGKPEFRGVSATVNSHVGNTAATQVGTPGLGFGDEDDDTVGGGFAGGREA